MQQSESSTDSPPFPQANRVNINQLHDDLLMRIFEHLHFDDKLRLRRTCVKWKNLLERQLSSIRALRLGQFIRGGYSLTSGLEAHCYHERHMGTGQQQQQISSQKRDLSLSSERKNLILDHYYHQLRQQTGTLFNETLLEMPADLETQCYTIKRFDYLHRALKQSYNNITMLSIGRIQITQRLLIVLTHNLPSLEHLELINCASSLASLTEEKQRRHSGNGQRHQQSNLGSCTTVDRSNLTTTTDTIPSLGSFNESELEARDTAGQFDRVLYQHSDEQLNVRDRLIRSNLIQSCELIREVKQQRLWPKMKHLLVKECNQLSEFMLCLLLSLTNQTLTHLELERNYHLVGELLNYCGPYLSVLKLRHCPLIRPKFVEDLVKIRQLLGSTIQIAQCDQNSNNPQSSSSLKLTGSSVAAGGAATLTSRAVLFAILFNA